MKRERTILRELARVERDIARLRDLQRRRRGAWMPDMDQLLHQRYGKVPARELASLTGKSESAVVQRARKLGLRTTRLWTAAQIATLREKYPNTTTVELARQLDMPPSRVFAKANDLGLHKNHEILALNGHYVAAHPNSVRMRFKRGFVPANKGTRRPGFKAGRMSETQFKKGNRPHTWKPIGTERVNADGYLDRKVSDTGYPPRDWRPVHLLLWQERHGPVPPTHAVIFKDGNKRNVVIENLECIDRRELMRRNSYHTNYPKEIGQVIQLRGQVIRQINRRMKQREEQNRGSAQSPVCDAGSAAGPGEADGS